MQTRYFELLGRVSIRTETGILSDLSGNKLGALLALLALSPGRPRIREEIIDLMWPEIDFEEARNRFRQLIVRLRKLLEPTGVKPGSVLTANRTQIGIAAGHRSDVAEFLQHLRDAAITSEPQMRMKHLQMALHLYSGEFAPGFYLDVVLAERQRLATLAESARERLAALMVSYTSRPTQPPVSPKIRTQNRFFGREEECGRIVELLPHNRLITLIGPGGTGKTRLAEEIQAKQEEALFIPLSGLRNGAGICDAIVATMALPDSGALTLARLQAALTGQGKLLILDNMEQLIASGGPETIASLLENIPDLRLVVTSRVKLNLPQECVFPLAPLPEKDAVDLFINRAQLAHAAFSYTAKSISVIRELCRRLDGLPLAIELAAARVAVLTPDQILERLGRRFDLLADKRRDREERHTSLRATLDWGWRLLAPDVQRFFARLCVFHGSFTLEAAETITDEPLAIDYLQYLADASFLQSGNIGGSQRFRLLETLRAYGMEKLDTAECAVLQRAHYDYYRQKTIEWHGRLDGGGMSEAVALFKQDQGNCTAAFDWALEQSPKLALDLCLELVILWDMLFLRRLALDSLVRVRNMLGEQMMPPGMMARLEEAFAIAYSGTLQHELAHKHDLLTLEYRRQQLADDEAAGTSPDILKKQRKHIAGTLHNIAVSYFFMGEWNEAQRLYSEAAEMNQYLGNDSFLARNLNGLYFVLEQQAYATSDPQEHIGLLQQAVEYSRESVVVCRRAGQDYFLCHMLSGYTSALLNLNAVDEAGAVLEEAFPLACSLEQWATLQDFLLHYHFLAVEGQDWEAATRLLGAAFGISRRWELHLDIDSPSYLSRQTARRCALPDVLGKAHYDALHQQGFDASLDTLKMLVLPVRSRFLSKSSQI